MKDLQERICTAANFTWQAIGDDILKIDEVHSLPKEEVIGVVIDCDYLERYGNDKKAVAVFRKLFSEEQYAILQKAFRCEHYGF